MNTSPSVSRNWKMLVPSQGEDLFPCYVSHLETRDQWIYGVHSTGHTASVAILFLLTLLRRRHRFTEIRNSIAFVAWRIILFLLFVARLHETLRFRVIISVSQTSQHWAFHHSIYIYVFRPTISPPNGEHQCSLTTNSIEEISLITRFSKLISFFFSDFYIFRLYHCTIRYTSSISRKYLVLIPPFVTHLVQNVYNMACHGGA